jgi:putative cell wall-binding protein
MGNVLNRVTKEYLKSVNTPDYNPEEWVINPSLPEGIEQKFIKIVDNIAMEMSEEEKNQILDEEREAVENTKEYVYSTGYFDHDTQITLKATEDAQTKFTKMVTLLNTALMVGAINSNTPQYFFDINDELKQLTTGEFLGLMIRYGLWAQQVFVNYE